MLIQKRFNIQKINKTFLRMQFFSTINIFPNLSELFFHSVRIFSDFFQQFPNGTLNGFFSSFMHIQFEEIQLHAEGH
eukprot:m.9002 g.9002  ORF g.9002 m.9002 type:complete len:77 (-) comp3993_c0_seq1:1373-1603(-)